MGILSGPGPLGSGPTGPGSGFCVMAFSWPVKMATTKANQETTSARHLDETDPLKVKFKDFMAILNNFLSSLIRL